MNPLDLEQWLKISQNLSFTSFLLLCVGVLAYALYRLYLYSRVDWSQVQQNATAIIQMNQNIAQLITKIDQLISELHVTAHLPVSTTSLNSNVAAQPVETGASVALHQP